MERLDARSGRLFATWGLYGVAVAVLAPVLAGLGLSPGVTWTLFGLCGSILALCMREG